MIELEKLVCYDEENDVLMEIFDAEVMANCPEDYYEVVKKVFEGKPRKYTLIDASGIVMGGDAKNMDKKTRQRLLDASMQVGYEKVAFVIEHPTTLFFTKLMNKMGAIQNPAVKDIEQKYFRNKEKALAWLIGDAKK